MIRGHRQEIHSQFAFNLIRAQGHDRNALFMFRQVMFLFAGHFTGKPTHAQQWQRHEHAKPCTAHPSVARVVAHNMRGVLADHPDADMVSLAFKDRAITWRHLANQTSCYGVTEAPGTAFCYNDWQMSLFWDTLFLEVYGATYENVDERFQKANWNQRKEQEILIR